MQRTVLRVVGLLSLLLALSSCDLLLELIGGDGGNAPPTPMSVTAAAGNGQVTVSWSSVNGATSYKVYYTQGPSVFTNSPTFQVVGAPPCIVMGLVNGMQYAFAVTAVNKDGESGISAVQTATPTAGGGQTNMAPVTPFNVQIAAASRQVTLSWDASEGATLYTVYYAQGNTVTTASTKKVTSATASATVTGLTNSLIYAFIVTASNDFGESPPSAPKTATPAAATAVPAQPVLTATGGDSKVTLTWSPVTGATSYNLYWSMGSTVTTTTGTKVTGVSSGYVLSGLSNGTGYAFILTALNALGPSAASVVATASPVMANDAPPPPANVVATGADGSVFVTWNAVGNADWYMVYYIQGSTVTMDNGNTIMVYGNSCTVTGLTNGTQYAFAVTAGNNIGESAASDVVTATPAAATSAPAAPADLYATADSNKVVLSWTASAGATSYVVYYKMGYSVTKADFANKYTTSQMTYTVQGLMNDTDYAFIVTAKNSFGESAASYLVTAKPTAQTVAPPMPPTGLTATASDGSVTLSWMNVSNATSYTIFYSMGTANPTPITYVYPPYTISGLTNGSFYNFSVAAVNSAGSSTENPSVTATPVAAMGIPSAPSNVWAQASDSQVTVYWEFVPGATSYNLYYKPYEPAMPINKTNSQKIPYIQPPFTKYALVNNTTYSFLVTAVNSFGEGPVSMSVDSTPYAQQIAPPAPTGLYASAQNATTVYLSWNSVSSATYYYVYRGTYPGMYYYSNYTMAPTTFVTETGLSANTDYYYVVSAYNDWGESMFSYEIWVHTPQLEQGTIGVTIQ